MSWHLSRKDDKYRIWSTVSDQYITDWISREEALAVWYDDALIGFKKNVIGQYLKFPNYWGNHDNEDYRAIYMDEEQHQKHVQWLAKLATIHDPDEYVKVIDETYEKIVQELTNDTHQ